MVGLKLNHVSKRGHRCILWCSLVMSLQFPQNYTFRTRIFVKNGLKRNFLYNGWPGKRWRTEHQWLQHDTWEFFHGMVVHKEYRFHTIWYFHAILWAFHAANNWGIMASWIYLFNISINIIYECLQPTSKTFINFLIFRYRTFRTCFVCCRRYFVLLQFNCLFLIVFVRYTNTLA